MLFGGHKFYLGRVGQGLLYLFFCWTFTPYLVAFIEFIILLTMNQAEFDAKYNTVASVQGARGTAHRRQGLPYSRDPRQLLRGWLRQA